MRTPTLSLARFLFLALSVVGLCFGTILPQPAAAWPRTTETYFLRFAGAPVLSPVRPTAMMAQFKESPPVQRTTYQEVGVWTAAAATATQRLTATTALQVWLGLKSWDDHGTHFDLRAELRKNGVVMAVGERKQIHGLTHHPQHAKAVTVPFGAIGNGQFQPGDVLSVRILAKVSDRGGHKRAAGVRLYYDAVFQPARFGVLFTPLNTAPVAHAGADHTGVVGQTVQLDGSGSSDSDGDLLTYQWALTERPVGSSATLTNPASVHPALTLDKPGNYTGQLIVHDGMVESAPDTVVISTVNSAPVANAGPDQTYVVGDTAQLNGSGSSDVDGDALTYQWTLTGQPSGSSATVANPTSVMPTLTLDKPGTYTGQLIVNDGTVNSVPDTVIISTVNSAPVANAGPDQTYVVGDTAQLDGSGSSDVDGDPLTYQWALTAVPSGSLAALSDPTVVQPTFVVDRPGTYVVQLLVHDGAVSSPADMVTISTSNSKPVANAGPDQSALVGTRVYLDGSGSSDVDGDSLTYQWALTGQPANSTTTLDEPTAKTPSLLLDKPGSYTLQLIVNDGTVDSPPDTATLSTLNTKPVADAGPDQEVRVGEAVQLNGSSSTDADGDPLTYQWSLTSVPADSAVVLTSSSASQAAFTPDVAGAYVAQLIVNDGAVNSDPDTAIVTVTVSDTTPPSPADLSRITIGPILTDQVTVTGAAGSVEGGARVTLTNTRTGQTVTVTATAEGSFTAQIAAQAGDSLSIVVTDAAGNASSAGAVQVGAVLRVTITEPASGSSVSSDRLLVRGAFTGPPNTGITINGVVALVNGDQFVANAVPLMAGTNTLAATATTLDGQTATDRVTITSQGAPSILDLEASPPSGVAPLAVTFTYSFSSTEAIQSLSLDFDGNGAADFTTTDATASLQHTYSTPGVYLARLTVIDAQGTTHMATVAIVVQDTAGLDAVFQSVWGGMNTALLAGNKATALAFLTTGAQVKYGPVFDALLPYMPQIIASYSPLQQVTISGNIGEYAVTRLIDDQNYLFLIYFLKDYDGVWRLEAM